MTEVILGCGHAWLISPDLAASLLLCAECCTAQPVLARFEGATSGRLARVLGGQVIIETIGPR